MLKKFSWIAALLAAFAMVFFGCIEPGVDDGSQPKQANDLVIEGDDIILEKIGSAAGQEMITIDGAKVTFKGDSVTSAGFSYEFPPEAAEYPEVVVYFKVLSITTGRPGLLIKNSDMSNYAGIVNDQDPNYQINDTSKHFTVGMEFDTGKKPTVAFKGGKIAFQHQAYDNGIVAESGSTTVNKEVEYTLEVLKIVFPGLADADVVFDADGGKAVESIIVQQGKEIGDLPVTTKDNAVFVGWYTTAASTIQTATGAVTRPVGTEVLSDYIVEQAKTLTLKAKWLATGVTVTKNSLIEAYPKFSGPTAATITVGTDGKATFAMPASWPSVKYAFPTELTTANGAGTLVDPYTYKYNVVELTVTATEDFVIQVQNAAANGNINTYPSGGPVVSLKKGVNTTFSVALSDCGPAGLAFQNKTNDDGHPFNQNGTVVTLVSAVFTEGTMYKVTFDGKAQVRPTNVPTQTIISGRKATAPGAQNWYDPNYVKATDFIGWYDGDKLYDFGAAVTANIDLVSKWRVAYKRTVTLNLGGGTLDDPDDADKLVQEKAIVLTTLPVVNPTVADFTFPDVNKPDDDDLGAFAGWFDLTANPAVQYQDATSTLTTEITKDVTLTAVWAPSAPKVFDEDLHDLQNGGYGATKTANDNEWTINSGYQRLRLDLGAVYPPYMYPTITIEFVCTTPTFRIHTWDASGNNTSGSPYDSEDLSTGTVTIPNSGATKFIGVDNTGGAAITLKIVSITLNP